MSDQKTPGQIAYEAASESAGDVRTWRDANQEYWEVAAQAVAAAEQSRIASDFKAQKRELRNIKQNLKALTDNVLRHLVWLDEEMKKPESAERGKRLAKIANVLERANDAARYHGLGVDFRKDNKDKERARVMRAA